jgi:iron-sulfur cluster repair protein YtfE (RIC family)
MDVIGLLKKDHQDVSRLLQRAQSGNGRRTGSIVQKICNELEAHTLVEEEIFYPAVRATEDEELGRLVDESYREHERVKQQVQALRARADEAALPGMLQSLAADVEHHVTEEEGEMFPRVRDEIDASQLRDLGRQVQRRKRAILGQERRPAARTRAGRTKRTTASRGRKTKTAAKRTATRARKRTTKTARGRKRRARR